jgi:hypothetical protein
LGTNTGGEIEANGFSGSLNNICGLNPETRAISYEANYNELDDTGAFTYENGVTYRNTGDGILIQNEQELIDGSTIRLFPLVGDGFSTGSSSSEQLRFVPNKTGVRTVDTDGSSLKLTFPSQRDKNTWDNTILKGTTNVTDVLDGSGSDVIVVLKPGTYTIQCTPVGLGSAPTSQGAVPNEEDSFPGGVGVGGESMWTPEKNTHTFSAPNGRWNGMDISSIRLSDGQMVDKVECTEGTNPAQEGSCTNVNRLNLRFIVFDDSNQYTVDILLKDVGQNGNFNDEFCTGTGTNERCIESLRRVAVYDDTGSEIFYEDFSSDGAVLSEEVDILDISTYENGDQSDLDRVKLTDATWVTSAMDGRAKVTVSS